MTINYLTVSTDKTYIDVSVSTSIGETIDVVSFWDRTTFKNIDEVIDLSSKLSQVSNDEVFTITNEDVGISFFNDVYFIEFEDSLSALITGVVIDLSKYHACILTNILEIEQLNNINVCDLNVINPFIILESIKSAFRIGFYTEGIRLINSLDNICSDSSDCDNCSNTGDDVYYSGINYN